MASELSIQTLARLNRLLQILALLSGPAGNLSLFRLPPLLPEKKRHSISDCVNSSLPGLAICDHLRTSLPDASLHLHAADEIRLPHPAFAAVLF